MARILPAEFEAQYGVTTSIFDSQESNLNYRSKWSFDIYCNSFILKYLYTFQ